MKEHIKAWNSEYTRSAWKGHYSLAPLENCCSGRLLDAGCGSGRYTLPLKMRGFEVVAVDISPGALKMAGKRRESLGLDIELLAANIYQVPFLDSSFDAVWCYGVLQHLLSGERELAVSEFHRVLRKGGLLFIEVLGEDDMRRGGSEVEPDTFSRKNGVIYHYFNKDELSGLLKGFSCRITESHKEKQFNGKSYIRHMVSAIAKKL